jgi:hypothetical protein
MPLSIFSNFRIDSHERLNRMKDSFYSFKDADIEKWVINFRGSLRNEAYNFLYEHLSDALHASFLESKNGWSHDSRLLMNNIDSEFVLYWIEDQICMCGPDKLNKVIEEMQISNSEYLSYSWFGLGASIDEFNNIQKDEYENIFSLDYNKKSHKIRIKNSKHILGIKPYIIGLPGVFSKKLFKKIIFSNRPYLKRWPKYTPFDFEKTAYDTSFLPIRFGVPKIEIFCTIDDDNRWPGSSLVSRGLYPNRVDREQMLEIREQSKSKPFFKTRILLKKVPGIVKIYSLFKRIKFTIDYHFG